MILLGTSQNDHSLGVEVHLRGMFQRFTVAVIARTSTFYLKEIFQAKFLENLLGYLEFESGIEEELNFGVLGKGLQKNFDASARGFGFIVDTDSEQFLYFYQ